MAEKEKFERLRDSLGVVGTVVDKIKIITGITPGQVVLRCSRR